MRGSVPLVCLAYIADDWLKGRRLARGDIRTTSGTHGDLDAEAVADYGAQVWHNYRAFAGGGNFNGRVAEIGPGDNDVVAWHLLAHGAAEVHLVDRFAPNTDPTRDKEIRAVAARDLAVAAVLPATGAAPPGLHRHTGCSAEKFFAENPESFDAILSCAVLEHLADPMEALTAMARALRPGGAMVHIVDLRDHGMFEGLPPLTFLTVPDSVWRAMTFNSGRPNRVVFSRYREWLAGSGLDGSLTVTQLAGSSSNLKLATACAAPEALRTAAFSEVAKVRPRLTRALRQEIDADLSVASFCMVARRPRGEL
jgi:SAM-dependent methyltransferase